MNWNTKSQAIMRQTEVFPWWWLHHDFDTIYFFWKQTKKLNNNLKNHSEGFAGLVKEVEVPERGILKRQEDQELEEVREEKKTFPRRKHFQEESDMQTSTYGKKEWRKLLPSPSLNTNICTYIHESTYLHLL